LGSLVVTYPFHPLLGQRLDVLFVKRRSGGVVLVCASPSGGGTRAGQVTLPVGWTDRGPAPSSCRVSVEVLIELDTLVSSLRGR
jgi:hypothetical protein